jgi:hypothetical protein
MTRNYKNLNRFAAALYGSRSFPVEFSQILNDTGEGLDRSSWLPEAGYEDPMVAAQFPVKISRNLKANSQFLKVNSQFSKANSRFLKVIRGMHDNPRLCE